MRDALLFRSLAGIFAAWFAGVMVDSALMHSCPVHEGQRVQAEAIPRQQASFVVVDETREHEAHGGGASSSQEQPTQSSCTCVGDCGVPPLAWTPLAGSASTLALAAMVDRGLPDYAYVAVAADNVLPFANGPPTGA